MAFVGRPRVGPDLVVSNDAPSPHEKTRWSFVDDWAPWTYENVVRSPLYTPVISQ